MRKFVVAAMLGGLPLTGLLMVPALLAHADTCETGVNTSYTDAFGNSGVQACVAVPYGVAETVTAAGSSDPTAATGYIVADGQASNPEPADGYYGADNNGPVACASGDYTPGTTSRLMPVPLVACWARSDLPAHTNDFEATRRRRIAPSGPRSRWRTASRRPSSAPSKSASEPGTCAER